MTNEILCQKWVLVINKGLSFECVTLIDSAAALNCINGGILPSQYFEKTKKVHNTANSEKLVIRNNYRSHLYIIENMHP